MDVAVIGAGYVGLVTAACLATIGHHVTCIEKDEAKLASLGRGHIPIYEPGLDKLVADARQSGRLRFSPWETGVLRAAQITFVAVGTPSAADGSIDISAVRGCSADLLATLDSGLIVIKSTVVPGTLAKLRDLQQRDFPGSKVRFASNPEFLREGHAVADFMQGDRIILGVDDDASGAELRKLYAPLESTGMELVETTPVSAEMIKYAANCYLATRLSFFNEIADLCEITGASYAEVSRGVALDARIGPSFMRAGPGYGGSCFPKDTLALDALARQSGATLALNSAAIAANNRRKSALLDRVSKALGKPVAGTRIALFGLAFKADTDDVRESPALVLAKDLMTAGADLVAFDPAAMGTARRVLPALPVAATALAAAQEADVLVLITEWAEFGQLQPVELARAMRGRTVIDLRHILDASAFAAAGFTVHRVGEQPIFPRTQN